MGFTKLILNGWRQFENIDIVFHPRLTVLTGANGAGKSTILRLLSQQFGWQNQILSLPSYTSEGAITYTSGVRSRSESPMAVVGHLTYTDSNTAAISVRSDVTASYELNIHPQSHVDGLHLSSHRRTTGNKQVTSIPLNPINAETAYRAYSSETINDYFGYGSSNGAVHKMKEAIISMAVFGPGNRNVQPNQASAKLLDEFTHVMRTLLPRNIGFKQFSVRGSDVVLETISGDFLIDDASGGLMSLIDLGWQLFLFSRAKKDYVVTFDEPENHLHPSMQRALMSRLVIAFPDAQFVVATHSPFVVSSVKDSAVYVLGYGTQHFDIKSERTGSVRSLKLDSALKAGTASEILRSVLGVPVTLPEWAEDELRQIAGDYKVEDLNPQGVTELRNRLESSGLGDYYSDALGQIVGTR